MRLPRTIYRVASTQNRKERRYGQKTGGTFESLYYAKARLNQIRKTGGDGKIFVCHPEWIELEEDNGTT